MAAGGAVALYPAVLSSCSSGDVVFRKPVSGGGDIRLELISHGMLAPNSHNVQPWLIQLSGEDRFDLYVDRDRLLPRTDPPARQIHISQGTFLETLKIAASQAGYGVDIDYFPQGEYGSQVIENKPVASVRVFRDASITEDPLFPQLAVRQSNKRAYDDRAIPETELRKLRDPYPADGFSVFANGSRELRSRLAPMLGKGMAIEVADRERNIETVDLFRFSKEEALKYRDGFTVANNGMTGFMRFIAETFFLGTREEAYAVDSSFAREGVKIAYRQAESAAAFGWIVSETNTRMDQLKTGHLYARINLLTSQLGIEQHPMSQVLQEYEDMRELQQSCLTLLDIPEGSTVQMLYRMGYADFHPHTKRRRVGDIVRT